MLLEVRKWTITSPAENYQNSLKRALLRRKKLHLPPFNLAHPVHVPKNTVCLKKTDGYNYYHITSIHNIH